MTEETDKLPPYEKPEVILPAPPVFCRGENIYTISGYDGSFIGTSGRDDDAGSDGLEIPTAPGENPVNPSPL